jgi:MoxR-like ATPase
MAKQVKNVMQVLRERLNEAFKERSDVVDGMLVALLSRQMMFLLGPAGTAKSALTDALCKAISGNHFQYVMGKFTTPEELYGPYSLKALEQDKYERITVRRLPWADIAFLDEIFKGSSASLNTLLPIINERLFFNGDQDPKIPLQVLFGASNEIPTTEELVALYDRFVLRYCVDRMQQDSSMKDLMLNGLVLNLPKLTMAQLTEEQDKAQALKISDEVVEKLLTIRREVQEQGFYVSDRKWLQIIKVIKAMAHLEGHAEVQEGDVEILENILWHSPDQRKDVRKIVQKHCNPLGEKILKIMDAVLELRQNMEKIKDKDSSAFTTIVTEANSKGKQAKKSLAALGDVNANAKLKGAMAEVDKLLYDCSQHLLGL